MELGLKYVGSEHRMLMEQLRKYFNKQSFTYIQSVLNCIVIYEWDEKEIICMAWMGYRII